VRIGPTAWPFTGFIHTYIHTDRQLDKYILDKLILLMIKDALFHCYMGNSDRYLGNYLHLE
jgi:hypothetical protein